MADEEKTVKGIVLGVIVGIIAVIIFSKGINDYSTNLSPYNSNVTIDISGINMDKQKQDMEQLSNKTMQVFNGTEVSLTTLKESAVSLLKIISTAPQNLMNIFTNMNSISDNVIDVNLIGWAGTILIILLGLSILFIILKVFI